MSAAGPKAGSETLRGSAQQRCGRVPPPRPAERRRLIPKRMMQIETRKKVKTKCPTCYYLNQGAVDSCGMCGTAIHRAIRHAVVGSAQTQTHSEPVRINAGKRKPRLVRASILDECRGRAVSGKSKGKSKSTFSSVDSHCDDTQERKQPPPVPPRRKAPRPAKNRVFHRSTVSDAGRRKPPRPRAPKPRSLSVMAPPRPRARKPSSLAMQSRHRKTTTRVRLPGQPQSSGCSMKSFLRRKSRGTQSTLMVSSGFSVEHTDGRPRSGATHANMKEKTPISTRNRSISERIGALQTRIRGQIPIRQLDTIRAAPMPKKYPPPKKCPHLGGVTASPSTRSASISGLVSIFNPLRTKRAPRRTRLTSLIRPARDASWARSQDRNTNPTGVTDGKSTFERREDGKLPTYTFRETAEQIEKDKLIFAQMGIDSTRLAFDGLIKAEFGRRSGSSDCSLMKNVLHQVKGMIQGGEISFSQNQDIAKLLRLPGAFHRRMKPNATRNEHLYLQFRVAGKPKESTIPRIPPEDFNLFVGVRKLVPAARLTCADFVDRLIRLPSSSWTDNFLLTMPYHSTPSYVLKLLLQRTYPAIESKWRPRVFAILKKWTQSYTNDFCDPTELKTLLNESELYPSLTPSDKDFHRRERTRLIKGMTTRAETLAAQQSAETRFYMWPRLLENPTRFDDYAGNIMNLVGGPVEMAKELTLVAQDRLQSLKGRDFVKKRYESTPRNQMKISDYMSRWIATTVLLQTDEKSRVATACAWLDVAHECREKKNFNTVFEVMAGLQQTPIYRLRILHKRAPGHKIPKYIRLFDALKGIVASDANYKTYRREIAKCRGRPCVPYFGVLLKDLFFYEEAKPKIKVTFQDGSTWIDVEKCNRMGQLVNNALLFKGNRYNGRHDCGKLNSIENSMRATRSEDVLYSLSYEHKPRGGGGG